MKRKILAALLSVCLFVGLAVPAFAEDTQDTKSGFYINDQKLDSDVTSGGGLANESLRSSTEKTYTITQKDASGATVAFTKLDEVIVEPGPISASGEMQEDGSVKVKVTPSSTTEPKAFNIYVLINNSSIVILISGMIYPPVDTTERYQVVNGSNYATLKEALTNVSENGTITIDGNAGDIIAIPFTKITKPVTIQGADPGIILTADLSEDSYDADEAQSPLQISSNNVTLKDITIKAVPANAFALRINNFVNDVTAANILLENVTIAQGGYKAGININGGVKGVKMSNVSIDASSSRRGISIDHAGDLTFENVTFSAPAPIADVQITGAYGGPVTTLDLSGITAATLEVTGGKAGTHNGVDYDAVIGKLDLGKLPAGTSTNSIVYEGAMNNNSFSPSNAIFGAKPKSTSYAVKTNGVTKYYPTKDTAIADNPDVPSNEIKEVPLTPTPAPAPTPSYSGSSGGYANEFYVNVIAGEHGKAKEVEGFYARDEKHTFTMIPDEGYVIDTVKLDNGSVLSHTDTEFILLVDEPYDVHVTFKKKAGAESTPTNKPAPSKNPQTGDSWFANLF